LEEPVEDHFKAQEDTPRDKPGTHEAVPKKVRDRSDIRLFFLSLVPSREAEGFRVVVVVVVVLVVVVVVGGDPSKMEMSFAFDWYPFVLIFFSCLTSSSSSSRDISPRTLADGPLAAERPLCEGEERDQLDDVVSGGLRVETRHK